MKKRLPVFLLSAILTLSLQAQWDSSGTQISFSHTGKSHRPYISAASQGSYYAVWEITDTNAAQLTSVWLNAFDQTGAVLPGWVAGGIKLSDTSNNYAPQLITAEDGNIIVAWCSFPHGLMTHGNIYLQKYSHAAIPLWNAGVPLQLNPDSAYVNEYPILVTDKHNGAFIAWNRYDTGIDPASADVFMQHIDSTGHVAAGWNVNPLGVAATPGVREYYPSIAITPDGQSIYVVYDTGLIGATSMLVNRFNTTDGSPGINWSVNGATVSTGPYLYHLLHGDLDMFTDSSDDVILLWLEVRNTANGELYMQTIDTTGAFLLNVTGQLLYGDLGPNDGTGNGLDYLEAVQDSDQNILVAYDNLVNFNDAGALRVSPSGNIIWSDTLITTGGYSAYPNPAADGKRGMFIFYNQTIGNSEKLYALEIDSLGRKDSAFILPGIDFGTMNTYDIYNPEYDFNPALTRRGESVIAWTKGDSAGFYQVYTCNLLSNGEKCITNTAYTDTMATGTHIINTMNTIAMVFPNPCGSNAIVDFISNQNFNRLTFTLYDVTGKLVLQTNIAALTDNNINTTLLEQGLYIYRISSNNMALATGKLIKQ